MKNKVLAIVVTYNRLEWLKRCIEALKKQTFNNFDIVIVNNGSTDGTTEWLDSLTDPNIVIIHQTNQGGAGGFYSGQKYGMEKGYKWLWLMDDDGLPEEHQLENLLKGADKVNAKVIGPLILLIDNPDEEAFCLGRHTKPQADTVIDDPLFVFPFNGILYHRDVMEEIGLIQKELFIWGDDKEYHTRINRVGIISYTALDAIHYHPLCKSSFDKAIPGLRFEVILKPEYFSKIFYRNNGYFNKLYNSPIIAIRDGLFYSIYFLRKRRFKELFKYLKWYTKGYFSKFPIRFADSNSIDNP